MIGEKKKIGILRGGPSSEYEVSLKTGLAILADLPEQYEAVDIFVSRDGVWHHHGHERKPNEILRHLNAVINAMHGEYGEDGKVQYLLETHGVPFTGSKSFASSIDFKILLRWVLYTSI